LQNFYFLQKANI